MYRILSMQIGMITIPALNRTCVRFVLVIACVLSIVIGPSVCLGQTEDVELIAAERILNDGIIQELVFSNLEQAEDLYFTVVTQYGRYRHVAAHALLRIAGCKEKGKAFTEARDLYIRVIREYSEIQDAILIAQSYLEALKPLYRTSQITIVTPYGGEIIDYNNNHDIWWFGGTEGGKVRIELLKNDIPYLSIHENADNTGNYRWITRLADPQDSSNDFKIRITDLDQPALQGKSDSTFSITILEVNEPDDDDVYKIGDDIRIAWTDSFWLNSVRIELLQRGIVRKVIVDGYDNLGEYIWPIPDDCLPGYDYQIRVTDLTLKSSNISEGYFTITP